MKEFNEMTYDELIKHVDGAVRALRLRAYKEGYDQGRFEERMRPTSVNAHEVWRKIKETMGPRRKLLQERRDQIVEKAKSDVSHLSETSPFPFNYIEFFIDKEKRTVVAIIRDNFYGMVVARGIAKCAPSDCFNVHIGKAIALRRALGLEVPGDYLNAPRPTEVRVGDIVGYPFCPYNSDADVVVEVDDEVIRFKNGGFDYINDLFRRCEEGPEYDPRIIDDSRE